MIKRILGFNEQDWEHIRFLIINMIKHFFRGNLLEAQDAYFWIRIHLAYDSTKIEGGIQK